ncbi:hypothetical protein MITS9504_02994 [Synechococcus sp. MIT S9504]|nr:hypothetical protein MITS9504_02994 [Synechococcus sp. MIT S9504]
MRKNRTLSDQNMLLRITFRSPKYIVENHSQECNLLLRISIDWSILSVRLATKEMVP